MKNYRTGNKENRIDEFLKKLELVGYCGNNCKKCQIYIATINNDEKLKRKIVERAEYYTGMRCDTDKIRCYGCRNPKSLRRKYLGINYCAIRECGTKKDVLSCGHCAFFPCRTFLKFLSEYSLKPENILKKIKKKFLRLGEYCENIDRWLVKEKKYF